MANPRFKSRRIFITDRNRLDAVQAIRGLRRGDGVILRDYDNPARTQQITQLLAETRKRGLLFLVAGNRGILQAHGQHWPEVSLRGRIRPRRPRPNYIFTAAAHGPKGLVQAARSGMDAVLLSPVFPTASHPGQAGLGPILFALMLRNIKPRWPGLRIYPLGGMTEQLLRRIPPRYRIGFAGISGFSSDPG